MRLASLRTCGAHFFGTASGCSASTSPVVRTIFIAIFELIKKSLVSLALGGFGIGMTEFVMMGILPDIAANLQISIPEAGYLISAYALGVVVGAPLLVGALASR